MACKLGNTVSVMDEWVNVRVSGREGTYPVVASHTLTMVSIPPEATKLPAIAME